MVRLQVSFRKLFEQFIGRRRSKTRSGSGSWSLKDSGEKSENIATYNKDP